MLVLNALQGCAHSYFDADGNRHIIGLVALTIPPADPAQKVTEAIRTRSIGLSLHRSEAGSAVVVGYSDFFHMAIKNHTFVPLDATLRYSGR